MTDYTTALTQIRERLDVYRKAQWDSATVTVRDGILHVQADTRFAAASLSTQVPFLAHRLGFTDTLVSAQDSPPPAPPILEAVHEDHLALDQHGHTFAWTDFYIRLKVAFRKTALADLKGAPLSVFLCLALHVDRDSCSHPGLDAICRETGYARTSVCRALRELISRGYVRKCARRSPQDPDTYEILGYAWFGRTPAPSLWELDPQ